MTKIRKREITIKQSKGAFSIFKKTGFSKGDFDFEGLSVLRQILSNEKARLLNVAKLQKPISIYDLAKKLNRSFKSVRDDVLLLERLGFLDLIEEKTKNRTRHRPEVSIDTITLNINI